MMEIISRKEALARGLTRYFTGKPCKHGHVCERNAAVGSCLECVRLSSLAWARSNPEKLKYLAGRWKAKNKEAARAYAREYHRARVQFPDREERLAHMKRWRDSYPEWPSSYRRANMCNLMEARRAAERRWKMANPDKVKLNRKLWKAANRGRVAAWRRARKDKIKQATPPWLTDLHHAQIAHIYAVAASKPDHHVDHIVPLRGKNVCGLHVPWNLQILPARINLSKGNRFDPDRYNHAVQPHNDTVEA